MDRNKLREEFMNTEWVKGYVDFVKEIEPNIVPTDQEKIADWWIKKISSHLSDTREKVEKLANQPFAIKEHVCENWADNTWMDIGTGIINLTDILSLLQDPK